ncbi:MAG: ABC transporter permease [Acidobacteriota bacterium]|nr:ABC transporter permease [Acidobacteriota bacterium]
MGALAYSLEQALLSLWRGRGASLLSIATITLALFVLGAFLLVTLNVQRLVGAWRGSAELSIYLQDEATPAERTAVEHLLDASPFVAAHDYVSKSQAEKRFAALFPDLAGLSGEPAGNPFPASIEVRLRSGPGTEGAVDALAGRLRAAAGVSDVRYDRRWIDRLVTLAGIVGAVGLLLVTVLSVAGALSVAIVVRLALFARRDEVEIMRLVGAPLSYIRGPFVTEGLLHGGVGALIAIGLLLAGLVAVRAEYGLAVQAALGLAPIWLLPLRLCGLVVVGGMVVGGIGGLVAAWSSR